MYTLKGIHKPKVEQPFKNWFINVFLYPFLCNIH